MTGVAPPAARSTSRPARTRTACRCRFTATTPSVCWRLWVPDRRTCWAAAAGGCSGGALIGLDLAARHPQRVDALVAHEPPAMNLLPDGPGWRSAFQSVVDTYRHDGAGPAMQQFITTAVRTGSPQSAKDEAGGPGQAAPPPPMPDMSQLPPEVLEGMARMQANSQFFLAHMLPTTIEHTPDIAGLQAASARIALGAGEASQGQMPHRAALALAERLGAIPVTFPGDHQGFATHPEPFAHTIHKAIHDS